MLRFGSPIERLFVRALYAELAEEPVPLLIHPQAPVGPYSADVMLQAEAQRVAVECDGHDFHERTPAQAEHDKKRDRFFTREGIKTLRFTGREITRNAADCAVESLEVLLGVWPPGDEPTERPVVAPAEAPGTFLAAVRSAGLLVQAEHLCLVRERHDGDGFVETVTEGLRAMATSLDVYPGAEAALRTFANRLPAGLIRSCFIDSISREFGNPERSGR